MSQRRSGHLVNQVQQRLKDGLKIFPSWSEFKSNYNILQSVKRDLEKDRAKERGRDGFDPNARRKPAVARLQRGGGKEGGVFFSPSLSDTHELKQVEHFKMCLQRFISAQNLMHVGCCNFIQLSDHRQSALKLPDRRRERERESEGEGEPALALSRGEDKCVLSPSFSSLNAGFVYVAPFSYFFLPGDMSLLLLSHFFFFLSTV